MRRLALLLAAFSCSCSQDPSPRALGEGCASTAECEAGLECLDEMPGGLCTRTCGDSTECPDGSTCVDLAGAGFCFALCAGAGDCRSDYACSLGVCDLPCADDEECPVYARCDPTERGCVLREDQGLGEPCRDDAQCASGLCMPGDAGGYCTEPCGGDAACDADLVCGMVVIDGRPEGLCRHPAGSGEPGDLCDTGSSCRSGACARGACVVPCGPADTCPDGADCVTGDVDVEGVVASADTCRSQAAPGVRLEEYGPLETERGCVHLEFDMPEDSVSFAIVAWTDDAVAIEPHNLYGPGDRELIGDDGFGLIRTYVTPDRPRETTILVPNTDMADAAMLPGHYRIDLCGREPGSFIYVDTTMRVRLLRKIRPGGVCEDGEMTLNIHLAAGVHGALTAYHAADNPWVQDILERVRHYYDEQCSVALGEVRYYDLDNAYRIVSTYDELYEMFETVTAGAPAASVNVFVVQDLSGLNEWIAGISGGLPGPPWLSGTPHSGLAFVGQDRGTTSGDTLAHEMGHFFGLYHPTEMNGMSQDAITDTPTCLFDPEDPWSMAECETVDNIMFPSMTPFANELTDGQCFVVRGYQGL
jgi:hypothetical protein